MKILVTGSNGFVGKKLVEHLRKKGHYVREFTYSKGNDILNKKQVEEALNGMNAVYHLAAELDENSKTIFKTNVEGTKNLVEAGAKAKIEQFIFVSTCGVYGKNENRIDENTPISPETSYEKSKAGGEKILLEYLEVMPLTIIRPPLVLGNIKYWKLILDLLKKGYPLIGNGKNSFQIVYLNDLVEALVFVLGKKDAIGETYIVAQDDALTFRQICEEIQKNAKIERKINFIPKWLGKTAITIYAIASRVFGKKPKLLPEHVERISRNKTFNISKIKALGWKPEYSTKEAIALTVKEILAEK